MAIKEYNLEAGISILQNPRVEKGELPEFLSLEKMAAVRRFHESIADYKRTPLVSLKHLAKHLGVSKIFVKDESSRFGLNAFKGLGGVYAVSKIVCEKLGLSIDDSTFPMLLKSEIRDKIKDMVFITATDGNHGKGVTWAAQRLGCNAYVYMPKGTVQSRISAISALGAQEVVVTDCNYDETVRLANQRADQNGWYLVQDTAWEGYKEIPTSIVQAYTTMASEIIDELQGQGLPTHLFLQAGVGAYAGGVLGYFAHAYGKDLPITTIVEPKEMACIYESAKIDDGNPHIATGNGETIMAGLNCGEPCLITWPILRDFAAFYAYCGDETAKNGCIRLGKPMGSDKKNISGESGAVSMGLLESLLTTKDGKEVASAMGLNKDSIVVLISTEGDTDPENYQRIIGEYK